MLNVYEATPEPSVLLACDGCESVRNLAVVLEGFGYTPLECKGADDVSQMLSENFPCLALVCLDQEDIDMICELINQRDDLSMLIMLNNGHEDPESTARDLGALAWEYLDAPVESILLKLRQMLDLVESKNSQTP